MNKSYQAMCISCGLLFDFDLRAFDEWLAKQPELPGILELRGRRQNLEKYLVKSFTIDLSDDESQPVLKRHVEFIKNMWWQFRREDAVLPAARMGRDYSKDQSDKANKRWANQATFNEALNDWLSKPAYRNQKASELWPHLYSKLDEMQLDPVESGSGKKKSYSYTGGEIKFEAFKKRLQRIS